MSVPDSASERPARPLIEVEDLVKIYRTGDVELRALDGVSFSVAHGEFVAVMGPSGSGKSTTMNMLGCLDSPTEGRYLLDGRDVARLSGDELAKVRNEKLGFVHLNGGIKNIRLVTPVFYTGHSNGARQPRHISIRRTPHYRFERQPNRTITVKE